MLLRGAAVAVDRLHAAAIDGLVTPGRMPLSRTPKTRRNPVADSTVRFDPLDACMAAKVASTNHKGHLSVTLAQAAWLGVEVSRSSHPPFLPVNTALASTESVTLRRDTSIPSVTPSVTSLLPRRGQGFRSGTLERDTPNPGGEREVSRSVGGGCAQAPYHLSVMSMFGTR